MDLQTIKRLSTIEQKTIQERTIKLQEEIGELAQEVLIASSASGSQHKPRGDDGIKGECVDILIVALSIFFKADGDEKELEERIESKCQKWERYQLKTKS